MSVCQYQIQTYQLWDLIKTWGFREGLYIYMVYTYLVPKGKYIYFPRRNVVIFPQSQRLRGNITTFLREKYIYSSEEQDMYSIHIFFKGFYSSRGYIFAVPRIRLYTYLLKNVYMVYMYHAQQGLYVYVPRRNDVIFLQGRRPRENITTFLRGTYTYIPSRVWYIYTIYTFLVGMYIIGFPVRQICIHGMNKTL